MMREWNAHAYHRISDPQLNWGLKVVERLPVHGDELVVDAGCGTGRLTAHVLERLPEGRVIAADLSLNMLAVAKQYLKPRFDGRVSFLQCDAAALPIAATASAIFSTATFHWVRDHARLFSSLYAALAPGGVVVAQCGGGPNIERLHARCDAIMRQLRFAPYFEHWNEPWEFADAEMTAKRLAHAGFVDIRTNLEYTPIVQPDAAAFAEFVTNVICRPHLAYLPDDGLRERFVAQLTELSAADDPPFELDYWRLNFDARRPD
jgi:trans-aconitate 2-methyltransferase